MNSKDKTVIALHGTRFENLLTRDNFFTRNDADSMNKAKKSLEKALRKSQEMEKLSVKKNNNNIS